MTQIYSVTQVNTYIRSLFERDFKLRSITVRGEISNCKYHSSGHIYFSLKDSGGQIACVMFAGKAFGLNFRLKDGMSVFVSGTVSVYERDGKYQLYAERIEEAGRGELYRRFEELKAELENLGFFDESHKKKIPGYIKTLGVITAATGAAVQDIINIAQRRNPHVEIVLYPARVQGEGAYRTLIAGLKAMERVKPDVIIIGRGGGSFEDLFEFNSRELAAAIYECTIPVISAVGHETDFTICDFVSDLRAPTPSAAAELAVYEYAGFREKLTDCHAALYHTLNFRIEKSKHICEKYSLKLKTLSPRGRLNGYRLRSDALSDAIRNGFNSALIRDRQKLAVYIEKMKRLSPLDKLEQGYSYVTDAEGRNIKRASQVKTGDKLNIKTFDGDIAAVVSEND